MIIGAGFRSQPQYPPQPLQARPTSEFRGPCPLDTHLAASGAPGPLRGSEHIPRWVDDYESRLRLSPEKLALRRTELMAGGATMLYRMLPLLFQEDLRGAYKAASQLLPQPGPIVTLAGDCHLGNFGTLRHQDGETLWSLNDFDQVAPGPVESDLCRAGASLLLLSRQQGWSEEESQGMVQALVSGYSDTLKHPGPILGLARKQALEPVAGLIKKAEKRTQEELLSKWAEPTSAGFRFKLSSEIQALDPAQSARVDKLLQALSWKDVAVLDRASRTDAGGSSLGLERYYVLAQSAGESLPRVVELKQVLPCALASDSPDPAGADADLLRNGFTALHAPRDRWHAVVQSDDGVYLVRERQRARDSLKPEKLKAADGTSVARQMGQILGQAHAGHAERVRGWMHGQKDVLAQNLYRFSAAYAEQMAQDLQTL